MSDLLQTDAKRFALKPVFVLVMNFLPQGEASGIFGVVRKNTEKTFLPGFVVIMTTRIIKFLSLAFWLKDQGRLDVLFCAA